MKPTYCSPDRRAFLLLGAGAGAALLSACTVNNPFRTERTPAAKAVQDLSPDVAAAVKAVTDLRARQADLAEVVGDFPGLTGRLAPLRSMHQAHLAVLEPAVPDGVDTSPRPSLGPAPVNAAQALARTRTEETGHRALLVDLAVAAESGPFARLLGSMSAAVSQQLVELGR